MLNTHCFWLKNSLFSAVFLLFFADKAHSQIALGVKWMGLAAHLKEYPYSKFYRGRLDRRGRLVATDGLALTLNIYLNERWHITLAQSYLPHDCNGKFLGMAHIGLGYSATEFYPHRGSISFGPMFFYRRSWHGMPLYADPEGFFRVSKNGRWQTKFVWYGGQMEYDYFVSPGRAFSLSVVPAVPELFAFAPGWKWVAPKK